MEYIEMKNQIFGKLKVIERVENDKDGRAMWLCECECGNSIIACGRGLRRGKPKSCGCERGRNNKPIEYDVDKNGCHICTSHKPGTKGYPMYWWNGKSNLMAKYIYEQYYNCSILNKVGTEKIRIRHLCHNPACINIEHLTLGTNKDNQLDKRFAKRGIPAPEQHIEGNKPENRRTFRLDDSVMEKLDVVANFYFKESGVRTKTLIQLIEKEYERFIK